MGGDPSRPRQHAVGHPEGGRPRRSGSRAGVVAGTGLGPVGAARDGRGDAGLCQASGCGGSGPGTDEEGEACRRFGRGRPERRVLPSPSSSSQSHRAEPGSHSGSLYPSAWATQDWIFSVTHAPENLSQTSVRHRCIFRKEKS